MMPGMMRSGTINTRGTLEDFLSGDLCDFPCSGCGKMLHWDPDEELEGDETWVSSRFDKIYCVDCYDKDKARPKRAGQQTLDNPLEE